MNENPWKHLDESLERIRGISAETKRAIVDEAFEEFRRIFMAGGSIICHPDTYARLLEAMVEAGIPLDNIRVRPSPLMKVGDVAAVEVSKLRLPEKEWKALHEGSWDLPEKP